MGALSKGMQVVRPQNIFITGAAGFIGSTLIKRLQCEKINVTAAILVGEDVTQLPSNIHKVCVEPLSRSSDYLEAVAGADTVIHLAARVHIMQDSADDPLGEFREVNTSGTDRLARQAAIAGVKRFIFMSTIGVNGNVSRNYPFSELDKPEPHNPYSVSKFEAENALREISAETGMEVVIIRAPLVYGPGNPGNFLTLLRLISAGIPLPFGSVKNFKSFIFVGNLVDALVSCAASPNAAGHTYLVSDGEDVSTPELIRRIASDLGRIPMILPCPPSFIRIAGKIIGKGKTMEQLLESLQVDGSKIRNELGWRPPFTMRQGIKMTVCWFKEQERRTGKQRTRFP